MKYHIEIHERYWTHLYQNWLELQPTQQRALRQKEEKRIAKWTRSREVDPFISPIITDTMGHPLHLVVLTRID